MRIVASSFQPIAKTLVEGIFGNVVHLEDTTVDVDDSIIRNLLIGHIQNMQEKELRGFVETIMAMGAPDKPCR